MKFFWRVVLVFSFILLVSCSRVSQSNFNKVQTGMTMDEVISILGEPTNSDSVSIAGISGTSAVWKDKKVEITIQFLNDKVQVKSFNGSANEE
jgi:outer membrane protein assembly factor BamE (lipoprotein component of BamABCDE complex)